MNDAMSLAGRSVLVVDDDFYLAMDASTALEEAGAAVIGPFSRLDAALASLQDRQPSVAVVDLNLGSGPSFDLAQALRERGVPVVIVTGYDKHIVPPALAGVPCLQKPVEKRQLLSSVSELLR